MNRKEKGLKSGVCRKANDTTVYINDGEKGPMTNVSFILTIFLALKVRRQYLNCGETLFGRHQYTCTIFAYGQTGEENFSKRVQMETKTSMG